jgi:hypothetical protein
MPCSFETGRRFASPEGLSNNFAMPRIRLFIGTRSSSTYKCRVCPDYVILARGTDGPSTRHALSGWQGSSKLTSNVCLSTIGSPECRTPFESTPVLRMKPVSNISSSQEVLGAADGKHQPQPCPSVDQPRPYASNLSAPPPLIFSSKNQSQIPMKKAEPPNEDGSNRSGKRTWRGSIRSF